MDKWWLVLIHLIKHLGLCEALDRCVIQEGSSYVLMFNQTGKVSMGKTRKMRKIVTCNSLSVNQNQRNEGTGKTVVIQAEFQLEQEAMIALPIKESPWPSSMGRVSQVNGSNGISTCCSHDQLLEWCNPEHHLMPSQIHCLCTNKTKLLLWSLSLAIEPVGLPVLFTGTAEITRRTVRRSSGDAKWCRDCCPYRVMCTGVEKVTSMVTLRVTKIAKIVICRNNTTMHGTNKVTLWQRNGTNIWGGG